MKDMKDFLSSIFSPITYRKPTNVFFHDAIACVAMFPFACSIHYSTHES